MRSRRAWAGGGGFHRPGRLVILPGIRVQSSFMVGTDRGTRRGPGHGVDFRLKVWPESESTVKKRSLGMKPCGVVLLLVLSVLLAGGCVTRTPGGQGAVVVAGEQKQWHDVTLTFDGPESSERDEPNPFLDYRLTVTFAQGDQQYVVPGYYAADGNAAETGRTVGNKWRVHFLPPQTGVWTYRVSFHAGRNIAVDDAPGKPLACDGLTGTLTIGPTDKMGRDFRAQGLLQYVGQRYLRFAHTGTYFIKGGADSPENFLAYADFDGTYDTAELTREGEAAGEKFLHEYRPHVEDWRPGDPTWRNGKGKGIIGALNYLAGKG
jgi:hypothetical protein